jgi:hypothetical protein
MANVIINDSNLTAIGNAIREKNGTSDTYKPREMADAILAITTGGGGGSGEINIPTITGDCSSMFNNNRWNWLIDQYGEQMVTEDITNPSSMFSGSTELERIPFDLNCDNSASREFYYMFQNCNNLTEIGDIINASIGKAQYMFSNCHRLRSLPNFINPKTVKSNSSNYSYMFQNCYSLRSVSDDLLSYLHSHYWTTTSYPITYYGFYNCYVLDEILGIRLNARQFTSNSFIQTFTYCHRVKNITFLTNTDGTPLSLSFRAQTIDLTGVGFAVSESNILDYNSGITADKCVSNDETYQALKDDPDWYTLDSSYSRYNHDSAVNTINSLPDTSGYVTSSYPNTIKFMGVMGEFTDGGAINTLTEEEIAVAAAKGWTVTFE